MRTYGQTKLNKEDVRKATIQFLISFGALVAITFLVVFLFFKSAEAQNKEIRKEVNNYYEMINRNNLVRIKMDTVYHKMTLLGTTEVKNNILLRNSIITDLEMCKEIIKQDSIGLKHYLILLNDMQTLLGFKSELMAKKLKEKAVKRKLEACREDYKKASSNISL